MHLRVGSGAYLIRGNFFSNSTDCVHAIKTTCHSYNKTPAISVCCEQSPGHINHVH